MTEIDYSAWTESEAIITIEDKGELGHRKWVLTGVSEKAEPVLDEMIEIIEENSDKEIEKAEQIEIINGDKEATRQVDLDNREVVL